MGEFGIARKKKKNHEPGQCPGEENEESRLFEELEVDLDSDLPIREKQSKGEKKLRKVRE